MGIDIIEAKKRGLSMAQAEAFQQRRDVEATRSSDQNRKFHAMCRDIANQMTWAGSRWSEEDFKRLFLGAKFGQPIVPNPFTHGMCVMNAKRSRDLTMEQMAELITEVQAFGDGHGVEWSDEDD